MKPAIVMQTDFGYGISTSAMEGVCIMVDPELRIFHNTHDIPNFDTYQASVSLAYVIDYWAPGTIFVSVVDPGVGTARKGVVAKLKNGSYVVGPDNGSLTHMAIHPGIESVREIDDRYRLPGSEEVMIFHGRDVFAYNAARLASGLISFEEVGEEYSVEEVVTHPITDPQIEGATISGMIESADFHFGLVSSNIPIRLFSEFGATYGQRYKVVIEQGGRRIYEDSVPYAPSFGSVGRGKPLLMNSEMKTVQIALNEENITEKYQIKCGSGWTIAITPDLEAME